MLFKIIFGGIFFFVMLISATIVCNYLLDTANDYNKSVAKYDINSKTRLMIAYLLLNSSDKKNNNK